MIAIAGPENERAVNRRGRQYGLSSVLFVCQQTSVANSFCTKTYPSPLYKLRRPYGSLQVAPWVGQYVIVPELQELAKETVLTHNLLARHAKDIDLVLTFRKLMTGDHFVSRDFNNPTRWSLWPGRRGRRGRRSRRGRTGGT